ncbi:hypothetical protein HPB49_013361 [Dermacentor silvarum]|uniref:Uncharacterized protein n=1 Tax=Dermacentor silvarum TaxID=543639 RepID=A0ACB8DPJ0_DERSI|nr:hypothetical protein HPB49_013361 [Dermacentor silvarum]
MATAMQITIEGDDIVPEEISESTGWTTALSKRKSAPASQLPRLPREHIRVIVRPRGGLDIRQTGHFKIAQALIAASGLTSGDVEEDVICPNTVQNIMVTSTPSERNSRAYVRVESIVIDRASYKTPPLKSAISRKSRSKSRERRDSRYRVVADDTSPSPDRASSRARSRERSQVTLTLERAIPFQEHIQDHRPTLSIHKPAKQEAGPTWAYRVKGKPKKVTGVRRQSIVMLALSRAKLPWKSQLTNHPTNARLKREP